MLNSSPFVSPAQWFSAGVFVAVLTLVSWTAPKDPYGTIGIHAAKEEARDIIQVEMSRMLAMEEAMMSIMEDKMRHAQRVELREIFEQHRKMTASQADRIRRIFDTTQLQQEETKSEAFNGLIADNEQMMEQARGTMMNDAVLIAGTRSLGHLQVGAYKNLIALMGMTDGMTDAVKMLEESLREELALEDRLSTLADAGDEAARQLEDHHDRPVDGGAPYQRVIPEER